MEFNEYELKEIFTVLSKTINPQKSQDIMYNLYSLPAFDNNKMPEKNYGYNIKSNKILLQDEVILFNKLNIKFKRIWYVKETPKNSIASTEYIPLKIKDRNFNIEYIYYYLISDSFNNNLVNDSKGTSNSHQRIDKMTLLNKKIKTPSLKNQNKIAKILSDIDKKIELNKQINDNLYRILVALYKKELLDKNTETKNLDDFCNIFTGKKNANNFDDSGIYKFFTCGEKALAINSFIYDGPAVIISGNGSYTGRTTFYNGKFDLYQRTYACTMKENINKEYIYGLYVIIKNELTKLINGGTHGSAIPYIVMDDLAKFKFQYEPKIFDEYSQKAKRMLDQIQNNNENNESLNKLRDILLPKLINGEINLDRIEVGD